MHMRNISKLVLKLSAFLNKYVMIYVLVISFVVLTLILEDFASPSNLINILRQMSMIAIISAGSFLVIVGGGVDISVGSTVGLSGMLFAICIVDFGISPIISIIIALLIGAIVGVLNGVLVAVIGIPSLIATFGLMSISEGLTYVLTDGVPVAGLPDSITFLGTGYIWVVPWPVIIMVCVFILVHLLSQKTKVGKRLYAVGSNTKTAKLAGINVVLTSILSYIICGVLAALSGILLACRLESGQPSAGSGWAFEAIIAVVIGGVSLSGGKGKVIGVFLGALLIAVITNGMSFLNLSSYYQQMIKASILVITMVFDVLINKKRVEETDKLVVFNTGFN